MMSDDRQPGAHDDAPTVDSPAHDVAMPTTRPYEAVANAHEMFERKRFKEAAAALLTLDGSAEFASRSVQELLARSYYHSAQLTKAADVARGILATNPTDVDAATLLARSLERAGRTQDADAAKRLARSLGADV